MTVAKSVCVCSIITKLCTGGNFTGNAITWLCVITVAGTKLGNLILFLDLTENIAVYIARNMSKKTTKKPRVKQCELTWRYDILHRWHTATQVLIEMFHSRGHPTDPEQFREQMTIDKFLLAVVHVWNPNTGFVFEVPPSSRVSEVTTVCFCRLESLGVKDLRELLKELGSIKRLTLVLTNKPKPSVAAQTPPNTEIFTLNQLACNITKHFLVPQHRLMTKGQVTKVLKRLKVDSAAAFNKILVTDPISRFYGAKVGQVFEIRRPTPGGHSFRTWRVVSRVPLK